MAKILEGKRAARKDLAALPFARKLELLEKLRDRSLLLAASPLRHTNCLTDKPKAGQDLWPTK